MITQLLADYGLFLVKTVTLVAAILIVFSGILALAMKNRVAKQKGSLEVEKLNDHYDDLKETIEVEVLDKKELKALEKERKKEEKQEKKDKKKNKDKEEEQDPRIFVLDFDGDIEASAVHALREEVDALLTFINEKDEVVVRLESPGGMVSPYGLAASQLARFRSKGVKLTIAVDQVAASGGYLMACVADRVIAAPFAVLGSIGVVFQMPNFHKVLKKHDVEYEQLTAGDYKRTLTMFGKNTKEGREKLQEELEDIHHLFKDFVGEYRPQLDIDKVATGEHWFGQRALELNLVDELVTSDDYLLSQSDEREIYSVNYIEKQTLADRFSFMARALLGKLATAGVKR
ncbi:protease SohB [Piscirickettsia litoralis]|uniref:Protease SohB n=1 Tax=Piscirickettsia litoralis TaxID=1891921 RepID=A0ABX3A487_9GAMM|nr:protease SohB [Piscirickettsia litoralis]ODN42250.1 protease SohB [Piscirickettsia litoralis]